MDYTLAVLTHGRSRTLDATLRSFTDKVRPHPVRTILLHDGPRQRDIQAHGLTTEQRFDSKQRGFCAATRKLWHWAGDPSDEATEFTFWLEHDFIFLRPVNLEPMAEVIAANKGLCQMQLMRGPVSIEEVNAGGLYQMREDDYTQMDSTPLTDEADARRWLQHTAYFTTNPSLMRTEWMMWNKWPDDDEPACEGRFSIGLVERGFYFGVWGSGEPWVDHVGHRDGFGY